VSADSNAPGPSLLEEITNPEFALAADAFGHAMTDIGAEFTAIGTIPPQPQAAASALLRLGRSLTDPVARLDNATARLGSSWQRIDSAMSSLVSALTDPEAGAARGEVQERLSGLRQSLDLPGSAAMLHQLQALGALSAHLRPVVQSVSNAIRLVSGVQAAVDGWLEQLK
jgi:hypothetical protein